MVRLDLDQPPIDVDRFRLSLGGLKGDPQSKPDVGQLRCELGRLLVGGNRLLQACCRGVDVSKTQAIGGRLGPRRIALSINCNASPWRPSWTRRDA